MAFRVLQGEDQINQGNDIENSDNLKIGVVNQPFSKSKINCYTVHHVSSNRNYKFAPIIRDK